ncbi:VWA domain-containing protein [Cystobacter fuscus]|uniref:adventurous gliding motility lipoprotein CglD n=1 Tax=Cystobacter fuscus TaxID=43 RepID=UPI002B28F531|nr:VWA domain-containing protein [Cystobacter fuscus]
MRKPSRPLAALLTLLAVGCSSRDTDGPDTGSPTDMPTRGAPSGDSPSDLAPPSGLAMQALVELDTDCDGLTDAEEWSNIYVGVKLTDRSKQDTDGDGLRDGVEVTRTSTLNTQPECVLSFIADADPSSRTNPTNPDTDGDGILDGVEDRNHNGRVDPGETDPAKQDSDADGLTDGEEDANHNGLVDPGETNPAQPDTDSDGLSDFIELKTSGTDPLNADMDGDTCLDGAEDRNGNGIPDPGETNPKNGADCSAPSPDTDGDGLSDAFEQAHGTDWRTPDSDCDGLLDGPNKNGFLGEDPNANGVRDLGETNPTQRDTDGDGLLDGVERGVATSAAPVTTCGYVGDADPSTQTSPTAADSDGDGIADGVEDSNRNGKVDPGERNPSDGTDGTSTSPEGQACAPQNQRQVIFKEDNGGDIRLALRPTFQEVKPISVGGATKGFIGYDSTNKVAFIAYKRGQAGTSTTVAGDELFVRGQLAPSVTETTQLFTTWDGHPAAQAFYEQSSTATLSAYTNAVASLLVGTGAGVLSGGTDVSGPFKIQAQYVHRSDSSVLVVLAITPKARYVEPGLFVMGDTAGGTALAQFGDADAVRCETFTTTGSGPTDFLFVVDDSGSMAASQAALGNAANAVAARLGNSQLDWRIALVTTSYGATYSNNRNVFRGFTRDINQFKAWLDQNAACPDPAQGCWIGVNGIADEAHLKPARKAVNDMTAATTTDATKRLRPGARLVVIFFTDVRDQSTDNAAPGSGDTLPEFINYFKGANPTGKAIQLHGILCDPAESTTRCNSAEEILNPVHKDAIQALGGIVGSIRTATGIQSAINGILDNVIVSAGYKTLELPIGASVRVALAQVRDASKCNPNDLPRSRTDGYDVDGRSQALSFYGACRPPDTGTTQGAISYRSWSDLTSNPNGNPPPCSTDVYYDPAEPDFCLGTRVCNRQTNRCE